MRKTNRLITLFFTAAILFSPCASAKKAKHRPAHILELVANINQKYENPKLQEKLSKIKAASPESKNADTKDDFKKYDLEDRERNLFESCFAWLAIVSVCIIVIRIICANFKIPFDYDPNFKNKYVPRRKSKNKKYNFQKR